MDWREEYAYTLGVQAYIFGFPYVYLPSIRWSWVTVPKPAGGSTPYAPLNHFHHMRNLTDASFRDGGTPNNDTLYSTAWVDIKHFARQAEGIQLVAVPCGRSVPGDPSNLHAWPGDC